MIYISRNDIETLGTNWHETTDVIVECIRTCDAGQFAQPLKPYLRYGDRKNRIIAMPAYLGGRFHIAGVKWIASFPDNVNIGKPRASSVVILNDGATGEVAAIVSGSNLSAIRTASVSGAIVKSYIGERKRDRYRIGIIGLGPIGRAHVSMCRAVMGCRADFVVFDRKRDSMEQFEKREDVTLADSWEEAYIGSDIVITCTVSESRYIALAPRPGALLLNVSLRDYTTDIFKDVAETIFVDDWDEVCRENTDVEQFHNLCGLKKDKARTLADIVLRKALHDCPLHAPIMVNPMGMAVFDVAIATYYVSLANEKAAGKRLEA